MWESTNFQCLLSSEHQQYFYKQLKSLLHLFQIISKLYFLSFSHKKGHPGSGQRADTRILSSAGFIDALPVSDPSGSRTSSLISYWRWCYQQCWEGDARHGTSQEPRPSFRPPWSMTGQHSPAPWVPAGMVGTPGEGWSVPSALPHFRTVEFTSFHCPLSSLCHTCLEWRWKRVFFFGR